MQKLLDKTDPSEFQFKIKGTYLAKNPDKKEEGNFLTIEGIHIPAILQDLSLDVSTNPQFFSAVPSITVDGLISKLVLSKEKLDLSLDRVKVRGTIKSLSSRGRVTVLSDISQTAIRVKIPLFNSLQYKKAKGIFHFVRQGNELVCASFEPKILCPAEEPINSPERKNQKEKKKTHKTKCDRPKLTREERIRRNLNEARMTPESNTTPGKHKRAWHIR